MMFVLGIVAWIGAGILFCILVLLLLPGILAECTLWRKRLDRIPQSALFVGRVWHTRFQPVRHAFTYPLFMFAIDLEEADTFNGNLWPLSLIVTFQDSDHLKNGEGLVADTNNNRLVDRLLRLVAERTDWKPTLQTHRVLLLTHLRYYGYCFNPVSFYAVIRRTTALIEAIVGEVSNTPWLEMHCYVCYPNSKDQVLVESTTGDDNTHHYVFPKRFHVSPFMEMDYMYDWTFKKRWDDQIEITNSLKRHSVRHFHAKMQVTRVGLDPRRISSQIALFPAYCLMIQIWIHYEAFWLFYKGVTFQPHPQGSETVASKVIGTLMAPFFSVQALLEHLRINPHTTKAD